MRAAIFDNGDRTGDAAYLRWLSDHPTGFVLKTWRRNDPTYVVLHKSGCHSISRPTAQMGSNPFTGRSYIKICAMDSRMLLAWIREQGGSGFSKRCSLCRA